MFYRDSENIYRVTELDAFPWLVHGFGTRLADIPAAFGQLATLKQIHSSSCVAAGGRAGLLGEGDALIENQPGSVVAVKTADCIPDPAGGRTQPSSGCGTRRLARYGGAHRGRSRCRHGRSVSVPARKTCTRPSVRASGSAATKWEPEVAAQFGGQGRGHIDLAAANRRQLEESGVTPRRIYASNLCTMCRAEEFDSFRRDQAAAGRMYSFAGIR